MSAASFWCSKAVSRESIRRLQEDSEFVDTTSEMIEANFHMHTSRDNRGILLKILVVLLCFPEKSDHIYHGSYLWEGALARGLTSL